MPVIIDEVTAVVDPAPPPSQPGAAAGEAAPSPGLDTAELARKFALMAQRKARLLAD